MPSQINPLSKKMNPPNSGQTKLTLRTFEGILYASTVHPGGFDILDTAISSFLRSVTEQPPPDVLWKMQFVHCVTGPSGSAHGEGGDESNVVILPPLSTDVVLGDSVMENVKIVWRKIVGEDDEMFMNFGLRETLDVDDEGI